MSMGVHMYSIDFPSKYQNWDTTDPFELFEAPTLKSESNPKVRAGLLLINF